MTDPVDSADGDKPPLDPTALTGLRQTLGDDTLLADIVQTFLAQTPTHIAELASAEAQGDHAALVATAHLIKGSALTFGATRLAQLCAALEASPIEAPRILPAVKREFDVVVRALTQSFRLT